MKNELKPCPFCTEDFDGYVRMLPREGIGNAYIHCSAFDGGSLNFSGKYNTKAKIRINFCPMCGRKLVTEDGN
jgi:hypothetical protein